MAGMAHRTYHLSSMTAIAATVHRESQTALPGNRDVLRAFVYLQLLDLLSTAAFLAHGVEEANPLVRFFMNAGTTPIAGLAVVKCLALGMGLGCWRWEKQNLLR